MFQATQARCSLIRLLSAAGLLFLQTHAIADKPLAIALEAPKPHVVKEPTPAEVQEAIRNGIAFLVKTQNPNGSWGSARRTKDLNIYAPVPGSHDAFRLGVTSLALQSLLEMEDPGEPATSAIDRAETYLLRELPMVRRANGDAMYNVWTHSYAISALVALKHRYRDDAAKQASLDTLIHSQFDLLTRYESVDGGWGYYDFRAQAKHPTSDATSFTTATTLIAFAEANQSGLAPPERIRQRAYDSVLRQRNDDFSYLYGEYLKYQPRRGINRHGGSLGRSQVCNLALRMWGDEAVSDEVIEACLDRLFARNGWLDIGRKRPIPHEAWFQVAGYFYYYGHYYASRCIELLPQEKRERHQVQLARLMVDRQEKDGSWWDYPLYDYHQGYGTAFALMTLKRCQQASTP